MPLHEYRRKRDFAKTPEPAPGAPGPVASAGAAVRGGAYRFVVQRHRATRLHYDLRLEIGGVLVSWAVPKGPTLDPDARRMAVHVEDHPLEYFDFEGVIPPRQYGAGDVIVWDWGTWQPEQETPDPVAAIANGEIKLRVHGEKLAGRFTIVRTGRRPGSAPRGAFEDGEAEQWLLIHKRDEHAVIGWDADGHPLSVKTGRSNDQVKAGAPAAFTASAPSAGAAIDLSAARPAAMPRSLEPMQATLTAVPFNDPDWLFEVKWDGYRVEAVVRDGRVELFTRNGRDAAAYFPGLLAPPVWIEASEAIVDGEVVALDDRGRPDFGLLQERLGGRMGPLVYCVFDLLHLDGMSLLDVPLEQRKQLLEQVLRPGAGVRYAGHVLTEGVAFFEAAKAQGLEGIVAKRRRGRYAPGRRSPDWLKLKVRPQQELVVGGWTPAADSAAELGALLVGVYEGERLRFAGKVGSGFDARSRRRLMEALGLLAADVAPFNPPPPVGYGGRWGGDLAGVRWVRPEMVIRATLGGWSREGHVRQGSFKGIEAGRDPREVVREIPVERAVTPAESSASPGSSAAPGGPAAPPASWVVAPEELGALAAMAADGPWVVAGRTLRLTHLDKVLFPPREGIDEAPVIKRELVDYLARVAPVMLPHLVDRPLNLQRFPDGAGAPGFWQKDIPSTAPSWLTTWHEQGFRERADRTANDHLVADSAAALCWLGNQAAFEIHAWTSTLRDPGVPTYALVDIDPGLRTTWDETLLLARLFRTAFAHLGVRAYPKLTGSRGIQAWIPLERGRYTYAATSAWVETLSRAIGASVPDIVSWEWAKAARGGRARLDYTQNAPIKTLVAPYAVRPRPGAPVSAPIRWEELDDPGLRPDRWTIRTLPERLRSIGDLWAALPGDAQVLPPL
jgi:bifunctional non-homologous end joining protein LigD